MSTALARSSLALRNAFSDTSTTAFSRVYASSSASSFAIAASHRLASPSTHTHPFSSTWISTFSSFSSSRRVAPFTPTRHGNASSGAVCSSFTVCSFTHASIAAVAAATFSAEPPTHSSSFSNSSATWNSLRTLEMCLPFVPTNTPPTRAGIAIFASTMPANAFSTSSFAFSMSSSFATTFTTFCARSISTMQCSASRRRTSITALFSISTSTCTALTGIFTIAASNSPCSASSTSFAFSTCSLYVIS